MDTTGFDSDEIKRRFIRQASKKEAIEKRWTRPEMDESHPDWDILKPEKGQRFSKEPLNVGVEVLTKDQMMKDKRWGLGPKAVEAYDDPPEFYVVGLYNEKYLHDKGVQDSLRRLEDREWTVFTATNDWEVAQKRADEARSERFIERFCPGSGGEHNYSEKRDPYCGARICRNEGCGDHEGLARCFCGFSRDNPGQGAQELEDLEGVDSYGNPINPFTKKPEQVEDKPKDDFLDI